MSHGAAPRSGVHRRALLRAAAAGAAAVALPGCAAGAERVAAAAAEARRALPAAPGITELVRFATLAANGHNTQPWRFRERGGGIELLPDRSRRTPAADPDDHHLYASLGCAAENLALAARARGRSGQVRFDATGDGLARVDLEPAPAHDDELVAAIPRRQCSRSEYDGRPVPAHVLARLARAAAHDGTDAVVVTGPRRREAVLELVLAGLAAQLGDPAFVDELVHWIRFDPAAALAHRDGLYSGCSGSPSIPGWLGSRLLPLVMTHESESERYATWIRSSPALVVLVAGSDEPRGWFAAGRACQRLALQATADGLKHAFVNPAVEVAPVRRELARLLDLGARRPSLILRLGYGPAMPYSLRRRPQEVLERA